MKETEIEVTIKRTTKQTYISTTLKLLKLHRFFNMIRKIIL